MNAKTHTPPSESQLTEWLISGRSLWGGRATGMSTACWWWLADTWLIGSLN